MSHGEPGLDQARKTFNSFQDKNLEDGFVARYRSGDYRFDPMLMETREAVALLTDPTRGRRYFEPCPTLHAPATPG